MLGDNVLLPSQVGPLGVPSCRHVASSTGEPRSLSRACRQRRDALLTIALQV